MRNYFKSGTWNVFCMVCNRKIKSDLALKRWDGLIVCPEDYENRHPLDFIRTRNERITVPFTADTAFNQFNGPDYPQYPFCTASGSSGVAGLAMAGCARPSLGFPNMLPVPQPEIPDEFVGNLLTYVSDGSHIALMTGADLATVSID